MTRASASGRFSALFSGVLEYVKVLRVYKASRLLFVKVDKKKRESLVIMYGRALKSTAGKVKR